jgi:hypothetical protein
MLSRKKNDFKLSKHALCEPKFFYFCVLAFLR